MDEEWVAVAYVQRPHGIRGGLKLEVLGDSPGRFEPGTFLWSAGRKMTIKSVKPLNKSIVVQLEGIETPEEADRFRGKYLQVPKASLDNLDEGTYYNFELDGMLVEDVGGEVWGKIEKVINGPGSDSINITTNHGVSLNVPLRKGIIDRIDKQGRKVTIRKDFFSEVL